MEVGGQLQVPVALFPKNKHRYPVDRRMDQPQSRSGHGSEEKKSLPLGV